MELMPRLEKVEDEAEVEAENSLEFLRAIYRSPAFSNSTRMRAAIAALPFEFPKLAVTALAFDDGSFAARLDRAIQRTALVQAGKVKVIEAKPINEGSIRRRV